MKRLINGMFSSIPDAEFMMKTLDDDAVDGEANVQTDANDKPAEFGPPDVNDD